MLNTPFTPWPNYSPEEIEAVVGVLSSNRVNYWTGEEGQRFEEEFCRFTGSRHAIALANGTVALDSALRVLGVGRGDEVVVTPRTFLASVSSIVNCGAIPVFADVDPDSQNITPDTVEKVLSGRTRALMCVHLAGWPCEMDGMMELAGRHDLKVIEDCAQAHGATYRGRSVGSIGHIGAWSFCQDKIMTTGGEGGMVTTNDDALWSAMWSLKDHGKSYEAVFRREHPPGFRWLHESFGTNFRLTEMQSAIGRIQVRRMPAWHQARTRHAEAILQVCAKYPSALRAPRPPAGLEHAWYKCYAFIQPEGLKPDWDRDRIMNEISRQEVPCYAGSCSEVYLEKAFADTGWRPSRRLPVARRLGETSLMFLVHPTLTEAEIERTCTVLDRVMAGAVR